MSMSLQRSEAVFVLQHFSKEAFTLIVEGALLRSKPGVADCVMLIDSLSCKLMSTLIDAVTYSGRLYRRVVLTPDLWEEYKHVLFDARGVGSKYLGCQGIIIVFKQHVGIMVVALQVSRSRL
jgi:hypothetical protein